MKFKLVIILAFFNLLLNAQDPIFTQATNSYTFLNPSFMGLDSNNLAQVKYKNQWPNIAGTFVTTTGAYYHRFNKWKSSLGLTYLQDNAGSGTILTNQMSLNYSQDISIKKVLLKVGGMAVYQQKKIDYGNLTFGDQIDQELGFINSNSEPSGLVTTSSPYFNLGASAFWKGFTFGGSIFNIGNKATLGPLKYNFQLAKNFSFQIKSHEFNLSPFVLSEQQQDFNRTEIGIINQFDWIVLGFSYRNSDAINSIIGIQTKYLALIYSYDLTVSKLAGDTGGSHELSVQFYPFKGWTKRNVKNNRIKSVFML